MLLAPRRSSQNTDIEKLGAVVQRGFSISCVGPGVESVGFFHFNPLVIQTTIVRLEVSLRRVPLIEALSTNAHHVRARTSGNRSVAYGYAPYGYGGGYDGYGW